MPNQIPEIIRERGERESNKKNILKIERRKEKRILN